MGAILMKINTKVRGLYGKMTSQGKNFGCHDEVDHYTVYQNV